MLTQAMLISIVLPPCGHLKVSPTSHSLLPPVNPFLVKETAGFSSLKSVSQILGSEDWLLSLTHQCWVNHQVPTMLPFYFSSNLSPLHYLASHADSSSHTIARHTFLQPTPHPEAQGALSKMQNLSPMPTGCLNGSPTAFQINVKLLEWQARPFKIRLCLLPQLCHFSCLSFQSPSILQRYPQLLNILYSFAHAQLSI